MKTLKRTALALLLLFLGVLGWAFTLPTSWKLSRSTVVQAPAEVIFPLLADLANGWPQWNVMDKEDPEIRYTYMGSRYGLGAERAWVSKKMGDGRQKITQADVEKGVAFELSMPANGFQMTGDFAFEAAENGTKVTWTDQGDMGTSPVKRLMGRVLEVVMAPKFEEGLANIKRLAEARQAALEKARAEQTAKKGKKR